MRSAAACPRGYFRRCAKRAGSAYAIHAFHWGYSDTGLFGFYAATGARESRRACAGRARLPRRRRRTISARRRSRRAKAQMKVSLLAALESPSPRCEQIARQMMAFGRVLSREEIIAKIDGLDIEDIRAAGARALRSAPTVAAIGPVGKVLGAGPRRATSARLLGRERGGAVSASAPIAKTPISFAARGSICGRPKCATSRPGRRCASKAAPS